jgi:hypothetical protein
MGACSPERLLGLAGIKMDWIKGMHQNPDAHHNVMLAMIHASCLSGYQAISNFAAPQLPKTFDVDS